MAEEYMAASERLLYAGGGRLWLVEPSRGRVLEAPEEAGLVLRVADRFRTLGELRRVLLQTGWQDDGSGALDSLLAGLVASGALRSRSDVLGRILEAEPEPTPPPIDAICWITRDRPALLRRSVESAIANLRRYGRRAELRVYDDSADAGTRQATRELLAELGRREDFPVFYAGAEEKRAYAAALQGRAKEVSAEILQFALFDPFGIGYTPGANTNAAMLDNLGRCFLHADDDTVFRFAHPPQGPPKAGTGLRLSAAQDPTEMRFYRSVRERETAVSPGDMDILAAHEALLGRSVADCLRRQAGPADCRELPPDSLPLVTGEGRVPATMAGACGDSGMGSALFVLWLSGGSREAAIASEESYQSAKSSREVLRAAPAVTLSRSPFLMSMHCGLDNRRNLPPFLPVLRNADGVFGQMLRAARPNGPIAHLPAAVLHLPGEPRAFQDKGEKPRLGSLLVLLVRSLAPAAWLAEPEQRLAAIGRGLVQAGNLPPAGFAALLRGLWAEEMSRHILALEGLLQEHGGEPQYWLQDAKAWLEQVHRQLTAEEALLPADLPAPQAAAAQGLVRAYGELILAWPALREAASGVAGSGRSLAVPLQPGLQ